MLKKKVRKFVVLNSGGFDSVVLMQYIRNHNPQAEIHSLFFSYGQNNAAQEEACSRKVSEKVGATFHALTIPPISWTQRDFYSPDFKDAGTQYLEMRNLIFLSYALSYSQSIGAEKIFMAILKSHYGYADTSPEFCQIFDTLSKTVGVSFETPFMETDKPMLAPLVFAYGVEEEDIFSCDTPTKEGKPCGECPDCQTLKQVFEYAGDKSAVKAFLFKKEKFGEYLNSTPIDEARLLINNECQLSCEHCFYGFSSMRGKRMTFEEYCSVIDQCLDIGIKHFHFSGKEPMVNADIFKYADYIKKACPEAELDVVTNGITVPKYADMLKRCGFSKVFLSVGDFVDPTPSSLRKVENKTIHDALTSLNNLDIPVQIFIDLYEGNYDNLPQIIQSLHDNYNVKEYHTRTLALIGNAEGRIPLTPDQLERVFKDYCIIADKYKDSTFNLVFLMGYVDSIVRGNRTDLEVYHSIQDIAGIASPYVLENFRFIPQFFCGKYENQITITPDGFVLGCGSQVSCQDYDKISSGNLREVSLNEAIKNGKKMGLSDNENIVFKDPKNLFRLCPHAYPNPVD